MPNLTRLWPTLAIVALLAACAGVKEGPAGQPSNTSVNPATGTRTGGNR